MTESTAFDVAMQFARIAQDIADQQGLANTRERIVELAKATLGCSAAAIWHRNDRGEFCLDACTEPELRRPITGIVQNCTSLAEQCLAARANIEVPDFANETRWPEAVRRVLQETPIRSANAYYLGVENRDVGVLALYADKPFSFSPEQAGLATVFAAHAAIALEDAYYVDKTANLEQALQSNRRIGMAIGVLMAQNKLTEQQAFDLLRVASQNLHVKLREIAEEVILAGSAPTWPTKVADPKPVRTRSNGMASRAAQPG
jgi:GAF domain-containing protein